MIGKWRHLDGLSYWVSQQALVTVQALGHLCNNVRILGVYMEEQLIDK